MPNMPNINKILSLFLKLTLATLLFVWVAKNVGDVRPDVAFLSASSILIVIYGYKILEENNREKELEQLNWMESAKTLKREAENLSEQLTILRGRLNILDEENKSLTSFKIRCDELLSELTAANQNLTTAKQAYVGKELELEEWREKYSGLETEYKSMAAKVGGLSRALKAALTVKEEEMK
jgi:predicted RNase H-like nuclease (RuvC/YqgF family)